MTLETLTISIFTQKVWVGMALGFVAFAVILTILAFKRGKRAKICGWSVIPALALGFVLACAGNPQNKMTVQQLLALIPLSPAIGYGAAIFLGIQLQVATDRNKARAYMASRFDDKFGW